MSKLFFECASNFLEFFSNTLLFVIRDTFDPIRDGFEKRIVALPREFRLKRKDVRNVFRGSRRFSADTGSFFLKKSGFENSRFGFGVPISVAKKANARNKLRRMASEWVRIHLSSIISGFDVFVVFKKEALSYTKKEFYKRMEGSFIKAGLLKGRL